MGLEYDPNQVTYEALLNLFWEVHDPTVPHPQGSGAKDQYWSAIFYHTPEQKAAALAAKERLEDSGRYKRAIATVIAPAPPFHRAEECHQRYFEKHRWDIRPGRLIESPDPQSACSIGKPPESRKSNENHHG